MNKERLLRLADALENEVPDDAETTRFNIQSWGYLTPCGFAGCAAGWAAQIPEFQEAGFRLASNELNGVVCAFGAAVGYDACAKFFELGITDTHFVFGVGGYIPHRPTTRYDVARRIREIVARDSA